MAWRKMLETIVFGVDRPKPCQRTKPTGILQPLERYDSAISSADVEKRLNADGSLEKIPSFEDESPIEREDSDGSNASSRQAAPPDNGDGGKEGAHWKRVNRLLERVVLRRPADSPEWDPCFLQLRPLAGVAALALAVGCVFGSLIILLVSDGQAVARWTVQPQVYLAIVAAIANSAVVLAFSQAVPISWWYHASRGGSVESLERHWQASNTLLGAIFNGRNISLLTLASIATSLVIVDGPFLQRSSSVITATTDQPITLDVQLPSELPYGFSGVS